ncbi:MAG TPA: hypothetical protein VN578_17030 [Candidatus Binatia bacterium]|jgi:hypothetical protein|nr:hypothetical protein [Candidatus Binatia bacterium]
MTELENDILTALIDLETTVKTMRTANPKPDLQNRFARLDELTANLPKGSDPNLLHYLHKKSYEKARLLLEGRDAENARGRCR